MEYNDICYIYNERFIAVSNNNREITDFSCGKMFKQENFTDCLLSGRRCSVVEGLAKRLKEKVLR